MKSTNQRRYNTKYLTRKIQIWRTIPGHIMDRRTGINRIATDRKHEPWGW